MILFEGLLGAFENLPFPRTGSEWAATILVGLLFAGLAWVLAVAL